MTQEEIKNLLKFIIRKCDLIINNKNYTADEYAQDKVEDIAEMCHRVLDGQFGEIIEPSFPFNLDEALKDLPRWKKCVSSFVYGHVDIDNGVLFYKYHYIHLSDLEKLPGFKED